MRRLALTHKTSHLWGLLLTGVGSDDGSGVGSGVGSADGFEVGSDEGSGVGSGVGNADGFDVDSDEGSGVGALVRSEHSAKLVRSTPDASPPYAEFPHASAVLSFFRATHA